MNKALRKEYLSAIGIESWTRRGAPPAPMPEARAPEAAAARSAPPAGREAPAAPRRPVPADAPGLRPPADAEREQGFDWPALQTRVAACTRCPLHATRTQTVFGVGSRQAQWLVVGEAPGAEEDARGEPFVGRAGQLLNSMLRAVGLTREEVYIANVLKCRPPHNRDPSPGEAAECLPYLEQQIALLKPKIMLAVGRIAAQNLLRSDSTLGRLRQQVHRFGHSQVPLIATYHPAYLLRTPADKRKAWDDLKFAREVCARV
jgi:uracil-DNA glycosylase family 4